MTNPNEEVNKMNEEVTPEDDVVTVEDEFDVDAEEGDNGIVVACYVKNSTETV